MRKRVLCSFILALVLLFGMTVPAFAAGGGIGSEVHSYNPIYLGWAEVDYLADLVLSGIPTNGLSDYEKIKAVYTWIQKNNVRTINRDASYFDEKAVFAALPEYKAQVDARIAAGQASIRMDYQDRLEGRSPGSLIRGMDETSTVAIVARDILYSRGGDCLDFSALTITLLSHLGYDCRMICGDFINSDGSVTMHKWCCVLIDGRYYWLDPRMDQANYVHTGSPSYVYFLEPDTQAWEKKHDWDHTYSDWLFANAAQIAAETMHSAPWSRVSDWAESFLVQAYASGLLPDSLYGDDMTAPISREEFAGVAVKLYHALGGASQPMFGGSPFRDCSSPDVLEAYALGIVYGVETDLFAPEQTLTRQQAAALMGRVYELIRFGEVRGGAGLYPQDNVFTDAAKIEPYAADYIGFFAAYGILSGMGDGSFRPTGTMTREQALRVAISCMTNL